VAGRINPYRRAFSARFVVVGLSGNLGFTHDPEIVFEAARCCGGPDDIHFLLSGWGGLRAVATAAIGSKSSKHHIGRAGRRRKSRLQFLSPPTSDIPYRKNRRGRVGAEPVSIIACSGPPRRSGFRVRKPRPALTVVETRARLGGGARPARRIGESGAWLPPWSADSSLAKRAVCGRPRRFDLDSAMTGYAGLIQELLLSSNTTGQS